MNPLEIKGKWWLPDEPDNKIAGILRFDGIQLPTLELLGSFKGHNDLYLKPSAIWGITSDASLITLLDSFAISVPIATSRNYPEAQIYSKFIAHFGFIGDHFENIAAIYFNDLSIECFNLLEWTRLRGRQWYINSINAVKFEVINRPLDIKATLDDVIVSLRHDFSGSDALFEFTVIEKIYLDIKSEAVKSFSELMEIFHKMNIFLSLGLSQATFPLSIEGYDRKTKRSVSIFYAPNIDSAAHNAKEMPGYRMLFKYEDILDNFEVYVQNWFVKATTIEPVYDLYASILLRPTVVLEQRFLNLVQALETYHRRTRDRQYVDKDTFKIVYRALIEAIPEGTSEELIKRIKENLPYVNQLTLKTRLTELANEHHDIMNLMYATNTEIENFIDDVKNTRNYFTHFEAKKDDLRPDGKALLHLVAHLRFFIEICLLTEFGMPSTKIKELMERKVKMVYRNWSFSPDDQKTPEYHTSSRPNVRTAHFARTV